MASVDWPWTRLAQSDTKELVVLWDHGAPIHIKGLDGPEVDQTVSEPKEGFTKEADKPVRDAVAEPCLNKDLGEEESKGKQPWDLVGQRR